MKKAIWDDTFGLSIRAVFKFKAAIARPIEISEPQGMESFFQGYANRSFLHTMQTVIIDDEFLIQPETAAVIRGQIKSIDGINRYF